MKVDELKWEKNFGNIKYARFELADRMFLEVEQCSYAAQDTHWNLLLSPYIAFSSDVREGETWVRQNMDWFTLQCVILAAIEEHGGLRQ